MLPAFGLSLLFSVGLCVHAVRSGQAMYWLFIILMLQPLFWNRVNKLKSPRMRATQDSHASKAVRLRRLQYWLKHTGRKRSMIKAYLAILTWQKPVTIQELIQESIRQQKNLAI